jgi:RecB family exonuclease
MERGAAIHKEAEVYIIGTDPVVPASLNLMAEEFIELKELGAEAELEVTFTKDWAVTGWFDKDAWCRIKIDAMALAGDTIRIIDFKTGKYKPDDNDAYEQQLELYALAALILYPDIKYVEAALWFVDSGDNVGTKQDSYTHAMVPSLKKKWKEKVTPMFVDTLFSERPNKFCPWCHFRKANSGPCSY